MRPFVVKGCADGVGDEGRARAVNLEEERSPIGAIIQGSTGIRPLQRVAAPSLARNRSTGVPGGAVPLVRGSSPSAPKRRLREGKGTPRKRDETPARRGGGAHRGRGPAGRGGGVAAYVGCPSPAVPSARLGQSPIGSWVKLAPLLSACAVGHNPRVLVRDAKPDDAEAIAQVSVESWRAAYAGLMPAEFLDGLSVSEEAAGWDRRLSKPDPRSRHTSVAIDGDRVVGYVTSGPDPDDLAVGLVFLMYVRPDAWGSGAGDALMAAVMRSLRDGGFREAVLWVLEANSRARRFYERSGWTREGSHRYDDYGGAQLPALKYRRQVP